MALASAIPRSSPKGREKPRISPPTPARSLLKEWEQTCESIGFEPFPWQRVAARYDNAVGRDGLWLYPEIAQIVARQNGKTRPLVPRIIHRLRMGRRIMHTAQNRELPREVFGEVAETISRNPGELAIKGGRIVMPRYANGQEEIKMRNGGSYRIVAPTRSGARGPSNDDVIIDEVRELDNFDFIAAAKPTLTASRNPQILYLSNAGDETSVVLNALRLRADGDPSLAYLEWSAAPNRAADDHAGWLEANPSIGHMSGILPYLEREYVANKLAGTMGIFETEHLCRWVASLRERLVDEYSWVRCKADTGTPLRPVIAVSMDPKGRRASVALAWRDGEAVALRLLLDMTGEPIDTDALGVQVKELCRKYGIKQVGHDPLTDKELVKYVKTGKPISGGEFANASAQFKNIVTAQKLKWSECDAVTDDLTWTSEKPNGEGAYHAVRALDDRPITASLAAIRAVWLASGPPVPVARVY